MQVVETPPPIPGFTIHGPLGQGGMATVWRAEQTGLGRAVALKVVLPQFSQDPDFRARFLREAQTCARIRHPHVVGCYAAGEHAGRLYMALELLPGGDLLKLLERRGGHLSEPTVLALARDCLEGLGAIEEAAMVHRDLKPANIFLTASNRATIADLGLARPMGGAVDLTQPGLIVGTPAYMAPEQARGESNLDIRTDLYALGATLFHLLVGRAPYQGPDPVSILVKTISDPLPDPRDLGAEVSPGLVRLIQTLCHKEPDRRFPGTAAASAAVAALIGANPGPTPPSPPVAARTPTPLSSPVQGAWPTGAEPVAPPGVDPVQFARLVRRVAVDQDGCRACLILAPGASFPRRVLEEILTAAHITYGLLPQALLEATRPTSVPRRLVIAVGDPPAPGLPGRSVRGERIEPDSAPLRIIVRDDHMEAVALVRPGQLVAKAHVEAAVVRHALRFGLQPEALRRLVDGPADPIGRIVLAKGKPMLPGRTAGWVLTGAGNAGSPRACHIGDVVARWDEGERSRHGMDVLGNKVAAPVLVNPDPHQLIGAGVSMGRDRDGAAILRAERDGAAQCQVDGTIRVVELRVFHHDIGAADPPITGDAVVVINGSVLTGARIETSNDVIIQGNLEDAHIAAGGDVVVNGAIAGGTQPLLASGALVAASMGARPVLAGSVKISGTVIGCDITASGSIEAGNVVGGRLVAGGRIQVLQAGDRHGTTTELWAGRELSLGERARLSKQADTRLEAERLAARDALHSLAKDADNEQRRGERLALGHTDTSVLEASRARVNERSLQVEEARKKETSARLRLAKVRGERAVLEEASIDMGVSVGVLGPAHAGVVARLGDAEPLTIDRVRLDMRLGKT